MTEPLPPSWASAAVIAANVVLVAIRAPHGERSRAIPVARNLRGRLETALLTLAWLSFFLPLGWACAPGAWPGDFPLHPWAFGGGVLLYAAGLRLFHRSHADLGTNWSITIEVREGHRLVTTGVYRRLRHPMYAALLLHSLGQALVLPNAFAGPAYLAVMAALVAARLGPEERMMEEAFPGEFPAWKARTARLVPGIW